MKNLFPKQTADVLLESAPLGAPVRACRTLLKLPTKLHPYAVHFTTSEQCADPLMAAVVKRLGERKDPLFLCVGKITEEIEVHEIHVNGKLTWSSS